MPGGKPRSTAAKIKAIDKENTALELRKSGLAYSQIGQRMGLSIGTVWSLVERALERNRVISRAEAKAYIEIEIARLDSLWNGLWPKIDPERNPDGIHANDVAAAIKVCERRAKLLGLDQPQRMEHSGPEGKPIEFDARREIVSRISGIVAKISEGATAVETTTETGQSSAENVGILGAAEAVGT